MSDEKHKRFIAIAKAMAKFRSQFPSELAPLLKGQTPDPKIDIDVLRDALRADVSTSRSMVQNKPAGMAEIERVAFYFVLESHTKRIGRAITYLED